METHATTPASLGDTSSPDIVNFIAREFSPSIASIWREGNIAEYLMATATQRHVWHAVLAASDKVLPPLAEMRGWLTQSKRKNLIQFAFGSYPDGMIHLLSKLGQVAESEEFYRAVHSALTRGDALSRTLQHKRKIDPELVDAIAQLPLDEATVMLASQALRRGVASCDLGGLSWLGSRIADQDLTGGALNAICKSGNPLRAVRKAIADLPFPNAPWRVPELLPIVTPEELSHVAEKLGNCLVDPNNFYSSCVDIQAGIAFYFRTYGDNHLLLKFCKFANLGWFLDECCGPQNRPPTRQEMGNIKIAVSHLDDVRCRALSYSVRY